MLNYEILVWVKENYQEHINKMKHCEHDISLNNQSKFHTEGDVWTHTMMVCSYLMPYEDIELFFAGLLHDFGKVETRHKKEHKNSISFTEHEKYSMKHANYILKDFEITFNLKLNKELILEAINLHQYFHEIGKVINNKLYLNNEEINKIEQFLNKDKKLFNFVLKLGIADISGRISYDYNENLLKYSLLKDMYEN